MRTTITLDEKLLKDAEGLTGIKGTSALVSEALRALVAREAARELIAMGGSDPNAELPRRRRPWDD